MSDPTTEDWELIATYVAGMASRAELERVEARMRLDPQFRARVEESQRAWEIGRGSFADPPTAADTARVWNRVTARIRAADHDDTIELGHRLASREAERSRRRKQPAVGRTRILAVAAAIVALLAISGTWILPRLRPVLTTTAAARQILAEPDRITSVRLDDGTRVWLAPTSQLLLPASFGADERNVTLVGRAYFEVEHDPVRPFIVHASGMQTRVLGTEFEVRAYADDPEVDVVVRSGQVAVRAEDVPDGQTRLLTRGDVATLDADGNLSVETIANVDAAVTWIRGRLVFDRTPLREVAAELERWTDVRIRITDPALEDLRLTATFEGESLQRVLDVIARLLEVQVHRDEEQILISPRPDGSYRAEREAARGASPQERTDP